MIAIYDCDVMLGFLGAKEILEAATKKQHEVLVTIPFAMRKKKKNRSCTCSAFCDDAELSMSCPCGNL